MWPNFNTDEAALCLNSYIAKTSQETGEEMPLAELDLGQFAVAQVQHSKAYKIVSRTNHDQELVAKVVGVVCSKTLPPFRGTLENATPVQRRKVRQHVKLCGAGATWFDDYETKLNSIVDFFSASVGPNRIEAPELGMFDGQYAVDFHTRYFEERKYAPGLVHVPFDTSVDPNGVLERTRGTELVHGDQNIVEYCLKTIDDAGSVQYNAHPPQDFTVGDIVEICGTFTLYPYRTDSDPDVRFKLVNGMRTLSLLNHEFAKAMKQAGVVRTAKPRMMTVTPPKRKYLTVGRTASGDARGETRGEDMDQA